MLSSKFSFLTVIGICSILFLGLLHIEDPQEQSDWRVSYFNEEESSPGYNLVKYEWVPRASLIALDGSTIHTWEDSRGAKKNWYDVTLGNNGSLITITPDKKLSYFDKNSNLIWEVKNRFHHAVEYTQDQKIVTLRRYYKNVTFEQQDLTILTDVISIFDMNGRLIREVDIFDVANHLVPRKRWQEALEFYNSEAIDKIDVDSPVDLFHTNSVRVVHAAPFIENSPSGFLVSFHGFDTIAIISLEGEKVLWHFGPGIFDGQHDPSLLDSGNILVLDNGFRREKSRVLEIDPKSGEIVWEYDMTIEGHHIFVKTRGGAQRLPNGNTLITASHHAVVFEINTNGELIHMYQPRKFNTMERFLKRNKPPNYYRVRRFALTDSRLDFLNTQ